MIQVKVSDGKTECVVDGEPAIIAAERKDDGKDD